MGFNQIIGFAMKEQRPSTGTIKISSIGISMILNSEIWQPSLKSNLAKFTLLLFNTSLIKELIVVSPQSPRNSVGIRQSVGY